MWVVQCAMRPTSYKSLASPDAGTRGSASPGETHSQAACGGDAAGSTARLQAQGHGHGLAGRHLHHGLQLSASTGICGGWGAGGGLKGASDKSCLLTGPAWHIPPRRFLKTTLCPGASICWSQDYEEAIYTAKLLRAQTRNKSCGPSLAAASPSRASVLHYCECSLAHSKKY